MQGDLLSSSYCVRLGRLRFRMEYKATGREAEGARGRQHTEEVSTHTLLRKDPRTGAGPSSTHADRRGVQVPDGELGVPGRSERGCTRGRGDTGHCEPLEPSTPEGSSGGPLVPSCSLVCGGTSREPSRNRGGVNFLL